MTHPVAGLPSVGQNRPHRSTAWGYSYRTINIFFIRYCCEYGCANITLRFSRGKYHEHLTMILVFPPVSSP